MARHRFKKSRTSHRSAFRRGGVGNSAALLQVDAMAYGAVRQYASNAIAPLTSKIPLGSLSDEVAMGLVNWAIVKYAGKGMLGNIARKGLVIENARVGEALIQGGIPGLMGGSSTTASVYMYG